MHGTDRAGSSRTPQHSTGFQIADALFTPADHLLRVAHGRIEYDPDFTASVVPLLMFEVVAIDSKSYAMPPESDQGGHANTPISPRNSSAARSTRSS